MSTQEGEPRRRHNATTGQVHSRAEAQIEGGKRREAAEEKHASDQKISEKKTTFPEPSPLEDDFFLIARGTDRLNLPSLPVYLPSLLMLATCVFYWDVKLPTSRAWSSAAMRSPATPLLACISLICSVILAPPRAYPAEDPLLGAGFGLKDNNKLQESVVKLTNSDRLAQKPWWKQAPRSLAIFTLSVPVLFSAQFLCGMPWLFRWQNLVSSMLIAITILPLLCRIYDRGTLGCAECAPCYIVWGLVVAASVGSLYTAGSEWERNYYVRHKHHYPVGEVVGCSMGVPIGLALEMIIVTKSFRRHFCRWAFMEVINADAIMEESDEVSSEG